jgi:hypothetical protein
VNGFLVGVPADIPGLVDAEVLDAGGAHRGSYVDITLNQFHYIAQRDNLHPLDGRLPLALQLASRSL